MYIALDVKADRLQKGARAALDQGISNISFVRARADQLAEVVSDHSVSEIWLTFSDPFPKKSDAKRRLTAPSFLRLYQSALIAWWHLTPKDRQPRALRLVARAARHGRLDAPGAVL
jgi:tRNA G46 methylase TrmB